MNNFVYITREEATIVKKELIELINLVQDEVREHFTFRYDFIGSASRNMITCDFKTNVGYDFDVNIRVNDKDEDYSAYEIRNILREAFNKFAYIYDYDYPEDGQRVMTIKVKDTENSRIIHSCDFAVVHDTSDGRQQYIRYNKKDNSYYWEYQPKGFYLIDEKIEIIKKSGKWNDLRDLYLDKKNSNTNKDKKSRSLFAESVNNIYNRVKGQV